MTKNWPRKQRNNLRRLWITFSVVLLFLVAACGGGTPPASVPSKANAPVAEKKKEDPAKVVAEKNEGEKKGEVEFSYNPSGKPDPFRPFIELTPARVPRAVPLTPLQKYDISQLKLVAIISTPEGNVALIEDGTKKGYFLKKGTWIGKNDGKVTKIHKDRVIVEEVYQDVFGQMKKNEITLMLHKAEEGGES
ncbi:MAG TPA: pilus assembly protein PilP [Thermodesulfobacteriota bacterium]|nr:pilus assembly protein PilP [Thermodesulfobacteriota bacterium]